MLVWSHGFGRLVTCLSKHLDECLHGVQNIATRQSACVFIESNTKPSSRTSSSHHFRLVRLRRHSQPTRHGILWIPCPSHGSSHRCGFCRPSHRVLTACSAATKKLSIASSSLMIFCPHVFRCVVSTGLGSEPAAPGPHEVCRTAHGS